MTKMSTNLKSRGVRQPAGHVRDLDTALIAYRAGAERRNRFRASPKYGDWTPAAVDAVQPTDAAIIGTFEAKLFHALGWQKIYTKKRQAALKIIRAAAAQMATEVMCDRVADGYGLNGSGVAWEPLAGAIQDLYEQRPDR